MSFNPSFSGGSAILDSIFKIANSVDSTKKIAFDLSAISSGQTRTITIPNFNIDLGALSTNSLHVNGDNNPTADINWGGFKITNLGNPISSSDASTKAYADTKQSALTLGNLSTSTSGITIMGGTGAIIGSGSTIDIQIASGSQPGLLSAADWTTFNSKAVGTEPLSLHINGDNSPTTNINWNQFQILNVTKITNSIANLALETASNSGQILLNIDGTVSIGRQVANAQAILKTPDNSANDATTPFLFTIKAGDKTVGTGAGGNIAIRGGSSLVGPTTIGGSVTITGGSSNSTGIALGTVIISAGTNTNVTTGSGNSVQISGGQTNGSGTGGGVLINSGRSTGGGVSGKISLRTGPAVGGLIRLSVDDPGNIVLGLDTTVDGTLATNATAGFLYLASSLGVPIGVPTAITGRNPIAYDRTGNSLYVYNGGWQPIGGGANASLSNLTAVAINASLLPAIDATIDIGSITNRFNNAWFASNVIFGGRINGHRVSVADTNYTVLITDFIVAFTSLTANRNVTLPVPTAALNGWVFLIKDESGTAGTNSIVLIGTVDGGSVSITANYGVARIYCNGTAYFTF